MDWKILSISAPDGELITEAKYFVVAANNGLKVETEGNWFFKDPKLSVLLAEVTEEMVIGWIKQETMRDGANIVETRLQEQLAAVQKQKSTPLPWMPQVFRPEI